MSALRSMLASAWLEGARQLALLRLGRRPPPRDLSRLAIVGALGRHNGIATGALLQHAALVRAGGAVQLLDATAALRNPFARAPHVPASAYVFHCGGPQTASLVHAVLPGVADAWRIGYWAWELPDPPADWRRFGGLVSEIWTPSRFAAESLGKLFSVPIHVVPHKVEAQPARRRDAGQPFTVLVMADSRSSFTRKNPAAAIEAFRQAFGEGGAARLVVKLNGGGAAVEGLTAALRGLPGARVITDFLDDAGLAALYRSADVLLSLHRAEGFGLPMLEAMAHGVPVIGTGWSGNTDFMTEANSLLVPYRLVPVEDAAGIYAGSVWAEPDIGAAAAMLRRLADDAALYARLSAAAHAAVAASRFVLPG
ncbi:MAG TPA: glycosyltransferase [Roseomonas sp.]|jgi:glycosyltransferase involved in cell wall biosynthesis